jgi:AcrR family transcriptional regulator
VPRKRAVTRERILLAAEKSFLENGFAGSYVEQIAADAGYTTGALYSNFKDKNGLFVAVIEARWQRRAAEAFEGNSVVSTPAEGAALMNRLMADQTLRNWEAVTKEYGAYALRNPDAARAYRDMMRRFNDEFATLIAPLADAAGIPAPAYAHIVLSLMNGLSQRAAINESEFNEAALLGLVLERLSAPRKEPA